MPENKAILLRYIDRVWNQHDYTAIDEVSPRVWCGALSIS